MGCKEHYNDSIIIYASEKNNLKDMNTRMGTKNLNEFDINWQQMVLPYEEQLEDILVAILNAFEVDKKSCMTGNGHICKHVKEATWCNVIKGRESLSQKETIKAGKILKVPESRRIWI